VSGPLAGLIEAFDAEAARVRDRKAPQSHAARPGCEGGLMRDCTAKLLPAHREERS
jgi:hypothetical protein